MKVIWLQNKQILNLKAYNSYQRGRKQKYNDANANKGQEAIKLEKQSLPL